MKANDLQILSESDDDDSMDDLFLIDGDNMMECHKWGKKSGSNNVVVTLSDIENIDEYHIIVRVFQRHITLRLHQKRVRLSSTFFP